MEEVHRFVFFWSDGHETKVLPNQISINPFLPQFCEQHNDYSPKTRFFLYTLYALRMYTCNQSVLCVYVCVHTAGCGITLLFPLTQMPINRVGEGKVRCLNESHSHIEFSQDKKCGLHFHRNIERNAKFLQQYVGDSDSLHLQLSDIF